MKQWFGEKILGLPPLASTNGQGVDDLIIYVHWLMIALFVGWIVYFFYALYRFRRSRHPKADYVGVKSHASNYIELAVAVVEAVLLIFVAVPLWAKAVEKFPPASESTVIQVVAQQFAWNVRYRRPRRQVRPAGHEARHGDNVFGVDPADPNGKDDIQVLNEIHVPVNKPVIIYLSSKDVIHSLKIIAMRVVSGRDSRPADSRLVHAHANRPLPDQLRAALRQRPLGHVRRFSDRRKPGGLRQVAQVQERRGHEL